MGQKMETLLRMICGKRHSSKQRRLKSPSSSTRAPASTQEPTSSLANASSPERITTQENTGKRTEERRDAAIGNHSTSRTRTKPTSAITIKRRIVYRDPYDFYWPSPDDDRSVTILDPTQLRGTRDGETAESRQWKQLMLFKSAQRWGVMVAREEDLPDEEKTLDLARGYGRSNDVW
ncbi:MAG: hypothetical protein Q9222_007765 [Ikaeria aurantiellina]